MKFILLLLIIPFALFSKSSEQENMFDCIIVPSITAELGSNSHGTINEILVKKNDFVEKGEVIAVLDNNVETATLALAKSKAALNSEIQIAKISYELSKREQKRVKKAFGRGASTAHDIDVAKTEVQLSKIKLLQARENKALAKQEMQRSEALLAHKTIRAPFSGIVTQKLQSVGQFIDDEAIVTLAKLDPLYVEVIIPISQRGKISKGMRATVCSQGQYDKPLTAKVLLVDELIDIASATFGVRLLLENPNYKIPAGLRCDIKFN